jgi:hypothetical protein
MLFSKAKQEFEVRYYLWATSEFEREIEESFPDFRSFKAGPVWKLHQFMQKLDRGKQLVLARSLLKRAHPEAVKAVGEDCSTEEESLRYSLDEFRRRPSGLDVEIVARRRDGGKIKFASKRKLRKVMITKFKDAFGSQFIESTCGDEEPDPRFRMRCCGWMLQTGFWFGRRESLIDYTQLIASEARFQHPTNPEISAPAMLMSSGISHCAWLGIASQTQWEYLMDDEVEPSCNDAMKFCRRFIEIAPKLLKGLDFEKIIQG